MLGMKQALDKYSLVLYNNNMSGKKTKIDLGLLRLEIRKLNNRKQLYRVLKEELTKIDHWKQRGRGDPIKAFNARGSKGNAQDL